MVNRPKLQPFRIQPRLYGCRVSGQFLSIPIVCWKNHAQNILKSLYIYIYCLHPYLPRKCVPIVLQLIPPHVHQFHPRFARTPDFPCLLRYSNALKNSPFTHLLMSCGSSSVFDIQFWQNINSIQFPKYQHIMKYIITIWYNMCQISPCVHVQPILWNHCSISPPRSSSTPSLIALNPHRFQYQVMVIHDDWMTTGGYPHDFGYLHI